MQPMMGLLFLLLALTAMFFLVRGWDAVREQFGAQLQDLFGPHDELPKAHIRATGRNRPMGPLPAHVEHLGGVRAQVPKRVDASRLAVRHRPTSRHH